MATVSVNLRGAGPYWTKACQQSAKDLNWLFKQKGIKVVLDTAGSTGPTITVMSDPTIQGTLVHGKTEAETDSSGKMLGAKTRLPVKVTVNTPAGERDAGPGFLEVIASHEFVHALGHSGHNSHLMGQTMQKAYDDDPGKDKLKSLGIAMPPLSLATDSINLLKRIWN